MWNSINFWRISTLSLLGVGVLWYWWLGFNPAPSLSGGVETVFKDRWRTVTQTVTETVVIKPDGTSTTTTTTTTSSKPAAPAKAYAATGIRYDGRKLSGYELGIGYRVGTTPLIPTLSLGISDKYKLSDVSLGVTLELR